MREFDKDHLKLASGHMNELTGSPFDSCLQCLHGGEKCPEMTAGLSDSLAATTWQVLSQSHPTELHPDFLHTDTMKQWKYAVLSH